MSDQAIVDVDDAVDDVVVVDEDVADRDDARRNQEPVEEARRPALSLVLGALLRRQHLELLVGGRAQAIPEERQHHREQEMDAAEDVVGWRPAEHLAQRRRDEVHRRDDDVDVVERHRQRDGRRELARPILEACADAHRGSCEAFPGLTGQGRGGPFRRPVFPPIAYGVVPTATAIAPWRPFPSATWRRPDGTARRCPGP